jgi:hypothetical protein
MAGSEEFFDNRESDKSCAPVTKTFVASSLSVNVSGLGQYNLGYCPVSEVR